MTYSSRRSQISCGVGRSFLSALSPPIAFCVSSRMMSLHSAIHSSHTNTDGPAISLRTSCWLLPQNEQYSSLSPLFLSVVMCTSATETFGSLQSYLYPLIQNLVYQTIFHSLFRREEIIALAVACDLFHRTAGMLRHQVIEAFAQAQDVFGMDLDVRSLAPEPSQRLVDHHGGIGQGETLALLARLQQEGSHR